MDSHIIEAIRLSNINKSLFSFEFATNSEIFAQNNMVYILGQKTKDHPETDGLYVFDLTRGNSDFLTFTIVLMKMIILSENVPQILYL